MEYHDTGFEEQRYLDLVSKILRHGERKDDRTRTGTLSLFGERLEFDVSHGKIPLLTTKRVSWRWIVDELLWFISGASDTEYLKKHKITIWEGNTTRDFLDRRGLRDYPEGTVGPLYGWQWRHFGAEYTGPSTDYRCKGIDQLSKVVRLLKEDPFSRRILMTAWNPTQLEQMCLEPCHCTIQFNVVESEGKRYLDGQLYMRSCDVFLGMPYNIVSYSVLMHVIGALTGYGPRKFIIVTGDTHIYLNHIDAVKTQLERKVSSPFPTLHISQRGQETVDDFKREDFTVLDYIPQEAIKAPMAV